MNESMLYKLGIYSSTHRNAYDNIACFNYLKNKDSI